MSSLRATVIGAGIAGLSAAISLKKAGWDVEIFEQAEKLVPMGAALSVWPNAMVALDLIGRGDALRAVAQPINKVAISNSKGRKIGSFLINEIIAGQTAFLPTRTELQRVLLEGLDNIPLHLGEKLDSYSEDNAGVTTRFEGGREHRGELLIAADGIWSRFGIDVNGDKAKHAGYGGVLALSDPVTEFPTTSSGTEYWGAGERLGVFDLKGDRKYWFYMKNEQSADEASSLTRDFIANRMSRWIDECRAAIEATPDDRLIPFSIHAKPKPKKISGGRVVLVGDAAHAMEPNMGQGACQAIEDGVAVGVAAHHAEPKDVGGYYEKLRLKRARQFVSISKQGSIVVHKLPDWLGSITQSVMRTAFEPLAKRQMKTLFSLPESYGSF